MTVSAARKQPKRNEIERDSCATTCCGFGGITGGLDSGTSTGAGTPCLYSLGGRVEELAKQILMCVQLSSLSTSCLGVEGTAAYPSLTCTANKVCSQHCSIRSSSRLSITSYSGCNESARIRTYLLKTLVGAVTLS